MDDHLIGIGLDLSPHYSSFLNTTYYKHHPQSNLGKPGPTQGFNTGVVLYNLEAMRASHVYNSYLTVENVSRLIEKYEYPLTLAEQDWMTNLGWDRPDIFYLLPCKFNMQVSIQYLRPPWEEAFMDYHYCVPKPEAKVIHLNGCGPSPKFCGKDVVKTKYSETHSMVLHIQLDIPLLWFTLGTLDVELYKELLLIWSD
eukprot:TRINITY_DN60619_c0_g1_i1.p1 TRINITY_DN60619_c0_g1~~TRINITY_DN60619_c0_g1_i1.p1  ORF type:complete len:215 (-),score=40.37 TRINITY_DN60619_c0_g1_i1:49-642(-)